MRLGAAQVVVAPEYQGRVMTSTTGGADAPSFGWIGRAAISARQRQPHINVFGGEDRFWLGPEGGQFSLYFKQGRSLRSRSLAGARGDRLGQMGCRQPVGRRRALPQAHVARRTTRARRSTSRSIAPCGCSGPTDFATHLGAPAWTGRSHGGDSNRPTRSRMPAASRGSRNSGLVSVWILGMFTPSPDTTIAIPFVPGADRRWAPSSTTRISAKCQTIDCA